MSSVMLPAIRRAQILAEIRQAKSVNVTDLSHRFGVSYMTVCRDLDILAKAGRLIRVHGGALPNDPPAPTPGASRPEPTSADIALARAAARLIRVDSTIALARGPRAYALAGQIAGMPSIRVVTNSLWVGQLMHERHRAASTLITGGLGTASGALAGPAFDNTLHDLRIDTLFFDPDGIDARAGLTTGHSADATADAAFIAVANRIVVLMRSSAWGIVDRYPVAPIDVVDTLITDTVTERMHNEIGTAIRHVLAPRKSEERGPLGQSRLRAAEPLRNRRTS